MAYRIASLIGPTGGNLMNLAATAQYAQDGEWLRAAESIMPKVGRDMIKAARYEMDGAQSLSGQQIKDMTHMENLMQALGFGSGELAKRYDERKFLKQQETAIQSTRQNLVQAAAQARLKKDDKRQRELAQDIRAWNKKHPEWPIRPQHIMQSMRGFNRAKQNIGDSGIYVNPRLDYLRDKYAL